MITATFTYSPNGVLSLDLAGHADLVREGYDPVCAAVSVLLYTLANEVEDMDGEGLLRRSPHILLSSGSAHISAIPARKGKLRAEGAYRLTLRGLDLLAKAYPQCLKILPKTMI